MQHTVARTDRWCLRSSLSPRVPSTATKLCCKGQARYMLGPATSIQGDGFTCWHDLLNHVHNISSNSGLLSDNTVTASSALDEGMVLLCSLGH